MVRKNRVPLSTTVAPSTFEAIEKLATEMSTTNSVALDVIVREWMGDTENQPLKRTDVLGKLDNLGESQRSIGNRAKFIQRYEGIKNCNKEEYLEDRVAFLEGWFAILYDEILEAPIWNDESE